MGTAYLYTGEYKKYQDPKAIGRLQNVVDDKYLVISLNAPYQSEGVEFATLIVNIATGNEKYFKPQIAGIQIDSKSGVFTYQKVYPTSEPCQDQVCGNGGEVTVYRPIGQAYTEQLP